MTDARRLGSVSYFLLLIRYIRRGAGDKVLQSTKTYLVYDHGLLAHLDVTKWRIIDVWFETYLAIHNRTLNITTTLNFSASNLLFNC